MAEQMGGTLAEENDDLPALSAAQERALVALLNEPTVPRAAQAANVGLRTLRRWMAHDENFATRYRDTRREILDTAVKELQDRTPAVAQHLYAMVANDKTPATARVAAARAMIGFAFRGTEVLHVTELLETTQVQLADARRQRNPEDDEL